MNFTQKNQNRRTAFRKAREENRGQALAARGLRRMVGGAFGNESPERFNELAVGTTATLRVKGDKN